ncbi:charged multivesicular body protein 6-like isoform X3 [Thalassophryne amazonica]|uniref:charged multivesicular body protein 6-like isoform X3 n=1 Tax=Thalassophryne amazonica TaxID=390379 RepID=UPI0014710380|nr:charged multivesicular body protein 6-like isoform X3 [Thalassophryne amazonica]
MWLNNGKHFWPKESTFSGNRTRQSYFGKQLKQQRDKLKQYQKRVMLQLEKERLLAKQLLKDGRKEKALLLLKKKIYQYRLLDKTESQISNLECMVQDIEFMQIEMKVIEGLKVGNNCLKSMHEIMSIEDVERIMDETQESIDYQRGEAVTLPEVPTEPLPEVSEAAQAEPERKEARNKPDGEMLAV